MVNASPRRRLTLHVRQGMSIMIFFVKKTTYFTFKKKIGQKYAISKLKNITNVH